MKNTRILQKKLHLKKADQVRVLSGKDKGKIGKILQVLPKAGKVVVEGVNIHVRFQRPKRQGEKGQRLELPAALNISKVMLICPHCSKATRINKAASERGNFRKCKKCGKLI